MTDGVGTVVVDEPTRGAQLKFADSVAATENVAASVDMTLLHSAVGFTSRAVLVRQAGLIPDGRFAVHFGCAAVGVPGEVEEMSVFRGLALLPMAELGRPVSGEPARLAVHPVIVAAIGVVIGGSSVR